jgi:hypothetical protein
MSTPRDETRDGFYMEDGDPSVAQLLHERTFAFSFWPKVGGFLWFLLTKNKQGTGNLYNLIFQIILR